MTDGKSCRAREKYQKYKGRRVRHELAGWCETRGLAAVGGDGTPLQRALQAEVCVNKPNKA